ncbi:MAG TPA: hypothetical protein PK098_09690 [Phycisphaerales bacterium]|nr:hypothetical protein [Phycisphaerales bacterium]
MDSNTPFTNGTGQATTKSRRSQSSEPPPAIKTLTAPEFTDEELAQLVTDLLALKKLQIQSFLEEVELPKSGTKAVIRERVEDALSNGGLPPERIVRFLDEVIPWGKQHVILYQGPTASITNWRQADWVADQLKRHRLRKYLNATLPLALPERMKVSSVLHNGRRLRITAIKKREWFERNPEYDETKQSRDGDPIELRAFVHRVMRGLVAFEWDLIANTAFLQISQLPTGFRYEEVAKEFFNLVNGWLDIDRFTIVDLRRPIQVLHELEEVGAGETRSHIFNYRTLEGRRLEGKSASPTDPLLGEPIVDAALGAIRRSGVAHLGNFYWLSNGTAGHNMNPLTSEAHVLIVAQHNRICFPTPNSEQAVRHVLSRIRSHSA